MVSETKERLILRRIIAGIYDAFLLFGVIMFVGSVYYFSNLSEFLPRYFGLIVFFLATWGFFSYFWIRAGQTLGMSVWRLKIVSVSNEKISLKSTLIRVTIVLLTFCSAGILLIYSFYDKDGLTLADKLSKTKLIKL
jgi:uncharacterized RDD family membrane protein YckC